MYRAYGRLNPYRIIPPIGSSVGFFENFNQDVLKSLLAIREMENSLKDAMMQSASRDSSNPRSSQNEFRSFYPHKGSPRTDDNRLVYSDEDIDIELQYLAMNDRSYDSSSDEDQDEDDYEEYVCRRASSEEHDQEDDREKDQEEQDQPDPDFFEGMLLPLWCNNPDQETDTDDSQDFCTQDTDPDLITITSLSPHRPRNNHQN